MRVNANAQTDQRLRWAHMPEGTVSHTAVQMSRVVRIESLNNFQTLDHSITIGKIHAAAADN